MLSETLKRKLINSSGWALIGKVLNLFLSILTLSLMSRSLLPGEMGEYFILLSITSVAIILFSLGLNQYVVKIISENLTLEYVISVKQIIINASLIVVLSSLGFMMIIYMFGISEWFFTVVIPSEYILNNLVLSMVVVVLFVLQSFLAEIFRGLKEIKYAVLCNGLLSNMLLVSILTCQYLLENQLSFSDCLIFIVQVLGISNLLGGVILLLKLNNFKKNNTSKNNYNYVNLIQSSFPFLMIGLITVLLDHIDIFVVGLFLPSDDVALYGAALKLVRLVMFGLVIINVFLPPYIAELNIEKNKKSLQYMLQYFATVTCVPSIFILLLYIIFGEYVLTIVFDEFYSDAATVLAILSIGQVINVYTGANMSTLSMAGYQYILMQATFFSLLTKVLLFSMFFIGLKANIEMIAIISTLVFSVYTILVTILSKKHVGVWSQASIKILYNMMFYKNNIDKKV